MNVQGLLLGVLTFLIIGIFHPIVIKCEYYFTEKIWRVFLLAGLACLAVSLKTDSVLGSGLLGVLGFTCFWSIKELKEQTRRVEKGWYPRNPNRKD